MKNSHSTSLLFLLLLSSQLWSYPIIHSCEDAHQTGIYTLKFQAWTLDVECDMDTDGGGWLVLLTRRGGAHDFYKPWQVYSDEGIGSPQTEYILPLKFFHDFLSQNRYELLEEMTEGSDYAWAFYSEYEIGPAQNQFPLVKGTYDPASTNGRDNFQPSGTKFSTYDNDNADYSENCSLYFRTAGWFTNCFLQNPLGNYQNDGQKGIVSHWKGHTVSLDTLSWKVRRSLCSEGFGSTCTKCADGFHLPSRPIFRRKTCLRDCDMEGCQKCVEAFYQECRVCKSGYALDKDGKCHKLEPAEDPQHPNDPGFPGSGNNCNSTIIINKQTPLRRYRSAFEQFIHLTLNYSSILRLS